MKLVRNGREVKASSVDWGQADIRNYDVYQPSGPGNALGRMKFTFPNKHSVYMHDTQSKGLFGASQRTFSHGCVRVQNPQRLAETLLGIDKGWSAEEVDELLDGEPEELGVPLNQHIPVHITYFTAQVDDAGDVTTEKDVYGHEKRITQALEGKWDAIDKGSDHLAQVELARRLDDAESTGRAKARRSGRSVISGSYGGGDGGSQRIVGRGSTANDIFRQSFGY
jgi:murein L,D-transpeptidase YcbB/YkuD